MIDQKHAFTQLYEETYDELLKYIVTHCSNLEDANEILQDTYLDFYRALKRRNIIQDPRSYLFAIAKNKVKKHYTLFYRFKTISLFTSIKDTNNEIQDLIADDTDLEEQIMINLEIEEVWAHLKQRKQIIQKVFMLYYYFEMTHKEIAEALSISESSVKNYLYRTLKELRKEMNQDDQ